MSTTRVRTCVSILAFACAAATASATECAPGAGDCSGGTAIQYECRRTSNQRWILPPEALRPQP